MPLAPTGYQDQFDARGATYDDAMRRWPDARAEEFGFALDQARPAPGERLVDVPAGGGYLADHLGPDIQYLALETAASFADRCRLRGVTVVEGDLHATDLPAGATDVVVSVAGVHHEPDHVGLLRAWRRILRPGGRVAVTDVIAGSDQARFLDGFVDAHNGVGHAGTYLGPDLATLAEAAGFQQVAVTDGRYHWWFEDEDALGSYARTLFGLSGCTGPEVVAALRAGPGVDVGDDGCLGLRWSLRALVATNPG